MTDHLVELQHIYLEIQAKRWQHIDRFFLPYICYRDHYVTRNNKPDWQVAREQAPRSQLVTESGKSGVLEPLVPYSSVIGVLKSAAHQDTLSIEQLQTLLDEFLHFVVISDAELAKLKQAGLRNNMPTKWYRSQDKRACARFEQIDSQFKDLSI